MSEGLLCDGVGAVHICEQGSVMVFGRRKGLLLWCGLPGTNRTVRGRLGGRIQPPFLNLEYWR